MEWVRQKSHQKLLLLIISFVGNLSIVSNEWALGLRSFTPLYIYTEFQRIRTYKLRCKNLFSTCRLTCMKLF